jgi:hypothetical protein
MGGRGGRYFESSPASRPPASFAPFVPVSLTVYTTVEFSPKHGLALLVAISSTGMLDNTLEQQILRS